MSEYRLEISGSVQLSDYSSIYDYMKLVDEDDKLTVTMDAENADNFELLIRVLQDNNFIVATKGGHDDGRYYISAVRSK